MKPCTIGKRHKWLFLRNLIVTRGTLTTSHISKRGLYRCECGERKYGEPSMNIQ